jgi:beta-lactam-binding protein with PASTA domain
MPWRRRRQVTEEHVPPLPPRRPLIWPWLLLLLLVVAGGLAAAYLLARDDGTTTRVPDVVGLSTVVAVRELGQRGYAADVQARVTAGGQPGKVLSQAPAAGTELDRGNRVTIVVARGPGRTDVPRVVGFPVTRALVRLQEADLKGKTVRIASRQPKDRVLRQDPAPGTDARKGSTVGLTVSKGPRAVQVPSVIGSTQSSATSTLQKAGFKVAVEEIQATEPLGIVVRQKPAPSARAAKGSVVTISISRGPGTTTGATTTTAPTTTAPTTTQAPTGRAIPNVAGLPQRDALARLQGAGFRVNSYPASSTRPRGTVVSQRPAGGTRAAPNSVVRIDVSLGAGPRPLRTIPDVTGMPEQEAKQRLVDVGFTVRSVSQTVSDSAQVGVVLAQRPAAGGQASAGSQIILTVGRVPATT